MGPGELIGGECAPNDISESESDVCAAGLKGGALPLPP